MSLQTNSSPLSNQIVQNIDQLDLPIIQKHHIRLLAHCLAIFQDFSNKNVSSIDEEDLLRDWCKKQSQRFDDKKFTDLLYKQMYSTMQKLKNFSISIGKNTNELEIEDLVNLVQQNN